MLIMHTATQAIQQPIRNEESHHVTKNQRRAVLTELDQQAAQRLREHWTAYKRATGAIQQDFAESLGWSQGNLSQYLNGKAPLGMEATKKLAEALNIQPADIRQELRMDVYIKATEYLINVIYEIRKNLGKENELQIHQILTKELIYKQNIAECISQLGIDNFSTLFRQLHK